MPALKKQKIKFLLDNKEIDINKTIEENQIKKNTTIVIIPNEKLYEESNDKIIDKNKTSESNNNKEEIKDNK